MPEGDLVIIFNSVSFFFLLATTNEIYESYLIPNVFKSVLSVFFYEQLKKS